ncbi:SDR family NAD(P)-dependent oxidoreductase [Parapedobacter soli]|uniref:SDR family NAD(P)-dependent oxidoreductase n=1 Tax=Parapedobacter soli TaxID=416955 RepID=UPI0021C77EE0|nr:SDR family NAD(P)-dependent oxidoreductase [Parapedobacter soli]
MKIMLITGASRGIGAATALLAARNGYAVAVNYKKNKAAADDVVNRIVSQGGKAVAIQADVSRQDEIVRLFSEVDRHFGKLHCLINNAGILEHQKKFVDLDYERLQRMFNANVMGPFLCCQEAIKRMSSTYGGEGGTIVNVSSIASRTGAPFEYTDYAATKGV